MSRSLDANRGSGGWFGSFVLLAVFWGCSFAFMAMGLEALLPTQVAFWRLAVGAGTLTLVALITRTPLPRDWATIRHLLVLAALLNTAPFTLFAVGQQSVTSVTAGIINATTPLATLAVVLVAFREERPNLDRVAGLVLGFMGILLVLGAWRSTGAGSWTGAAACVGGVLCYGVAFPYSRRHLARSPHSPIALAAGQVTLGAALTVPGLLLGGVSPISVLTPSVVLAVGALGVFSSGLAYILNFRIVARAGATTASSVTYLTPVVATIVGVMWLGEAVSWNQPAGAFVVLVGVAVAQGVHRRLRQSPDAGLVPESSSDDARAA